MSFQPGGNLYTVSFGTRPEGVEVPHIDTRAPSASDYQYPIGKWWVNTLANTNYQLTSFTTSNAVVSAKWTGLAGSEVTSVSGTANQITSTGTTAITLSIPTTFIAPGSIASTTSITSGTTLTATSGAITATNGNLVLGTAGNKIDIATGANASVGVTGAMSGTPGVVTVSSTAVTTSSVILYSRATTGGTEGNVSISAQSAGSFTLTSTGNETSTFNYLIIN